MCSRPVASHAARNFGMVAVVGLFLLIAGLIVVL